MSRNKPTAITHEPKRCLVCGVIVEDLPTKMIKISENAKVEGCIYHD